MARIRSIKPEFWTDEALGDCSRDARLLFVGTWTFADDHGNLDRSAKQLKAQVFPYDVIDCEPLIAELIASGVVSEYEVAGKKYLHINNFAKHQKVENASKPKFPLPDSSPSPQITLPDSSPSPQIGGEGRGREKEGSREGEGSTPAIAGVVSSEPADLLGDIGNIECPHQAIIDAYHRKFPVGQKIRVSRWAGSQSERNLRSRWREGLASKDGWFRYGTQAEGIEKWSEFFDVCASSDFLAGRVPGREGKAPFVADLHWLVIRGNFDKVLSNKYHREAA